jgi:hypothetical protein
MSQYDFGVIDPYVVDGVQLADMLNQWRDAIHSWHRGPARPSYAVPGMMWINDTGGATNWVVNVYISPTVGDKAVFTYNTTTGDVTLSAAAGGSLVAAILLAQASANPSVRWSATGNPVDLKNWRATVTGTGALRFSQYNDAGTEIAYTELPAGGAGAQPMMRLYSEQVLGAAAAEMRVNIPAGAKAIELWFSGLTSGGSDAVHMVQGLNGSTPVVTANHNAQSSYGLGANAAGILNTAQTGWLLGTMAGSIGVFRPTLITGQVIGNAQYWAFQSAGSRLAMNTVIDGGPSAPTGFRYLVNVGTLAAGSFLRCLAL